jgi:hypothetical protein
MCRRTVVAESQQESVKTWDGPQRNGIKKIKNEREGGEREGKIN